MGTLAKVRREREGAEKDKKKKSWGTEVEKEDSWPCLDSPCGQIVTSLEGALLRFGLRWERDGASATGAGPSRNKQVASASFGEHSYFILIGRLIFHFPLDAGEGLYSFVLVRTRIVSYLT